MALRCYKWVTHVLSGLQTWGLMPPYPKNTMNVAAPQTDAPVAVRVQFFEHDPKKNCLAQRGPKRGGRATPSGVGHIYNEI